MPTYKRYVIKEGNRILFFTSKPKQWSRTFWQDYNNYSYRIAGIMPREAADYEGLLDDPKARIAIQNHSEEEYYQKVLDEYNRLHQTTEG